MVCFDKEPAIRTLPVHFRRDRTKNTEHVAIAVDRGFFIRFIISA
jgi:hypothetical protein